MIDVEKRKRAFEFWMSEQFGSNIKPQLTNFHFEDGYADQNINAIWIGFNGGILMADDI